MSALTPTLPLALAVLCLACEALYPFGAATCPRCGSTTFYPLASWLSSRPEEVPCPPPS